MYIKSVAIVKMRNEEVTYYVNDYFKGHLDAKPILMLNLRHCLQSYVTDNDDGKCSLTNCWNNRIDTAVTMMLTTMPMMMIPTMMTMMMIYI